MAFTTQLQGAGAFGRPLYKSRAATDPQNPAQQLPAAPQVQGTVAGQTPTFLQMQAQGQPRPAPPSVPAVNGLPGGFGRTMTPHPAIPAGANPMPTYPPTGGITPPTHPTDGLPWNGAPQTGQKSNIPLAPEIQQAILAMLTGGSAYNSDAVKATYDRLGQGIDDEYTQSQRKLGESLAARGLGTVDDSSVGLGTLSDLNVTRKSAKERLAGELADKQAQMADQQRAQAIQAALGFGNLNVQDQTGINAQILAFLAQLAQNGGSLPTGG